MHQIFAVGHGALATDGAIGAIGPGGDRTFDHQNVLAFVLFHGLMLGFFSLVTRGRHNYICVFERNQIENQLPGRRLVASQEGFRISGAALVLYPDDRWPIVLDRPGDGGDKACRQSQGCSGRCAELDNI